MNEIYFATNRNPDDNDKPTQFGNGFSENGLGDLRFGQVEVTNGKVVLVDATDVITGNYHSYFQDDLRVGKDIVSVLQGERSESATLSRIYVPHANKYRLVQKIQCGSAKAGVNFRHSLVWLGRCRGVSRIKKNSHVQRSHTAVREEIRCWHT